MSYFWKLVKAATAAALRGEFAVARMYIRWARAQLGPPPF